MLRKTICGLAVLAFSFSVAMAEDIFGSIKKIDDGKITVAKFKKGEKGKGEETTLSLAATVKVVNAKFNKEDKKIDVGEEVPGGLKNDRFKNIGKFGIMARITTNDDGKVTDIAVFPAFKKKKD